MALSTKQALLQALSAAGGGYISGEALAGRLGVSRAAIHKAAAALTAQGYALEAVPRRGYRLAGGDPFCAEAVGPYPAPIHLHDTLESTNQTAKQLALEGAAHGTLVLAGHQTAGRGRKGRVFESPAGKGVYLSLVLRVSVPASEALAVTISAAVAVARAVKALCGLELGIKWVNDLYYQGKKVCGILTEAGTSVESGQLEWLVVGIGLNLTGTAAGRRWPGPSPGSCWLSARPLTVWRNTRPGALCPATGSRCARRRRPTPPGPWPSMTTGPCSWSGRAAAGRPCATAR